MVSPGASESAPSTKRLCERLPPMDYFSNVASLLVAIRQQASSRSNNDEAANDDSAQLGWLRNAMLAMRSLPLCGSRAQSICALLIDPPFSLMMLADRI